MFSIRWSDGLLEKASMGSFGDRLRKEREQRSISLDDIALSTKIGTRMLRALEEEKFDQLPGGIFNKGFVRAYARHVGLDEEQAIADYMAALNQVKASAENAVAGQPATVPERREPVARERREDQPSAEIPWGLLALLLLLVALAFASWSYYHRDQHLDSRNEAAPTASGNTTGGESSPAGESAGRGRPGVAPAAPAASPAQSSQQPLSQRSAAGQPAPPATAASLVSPSPTGMFTVLLKGNEESEESWVSIAIDGQPPVEAMLSAPKQREVQANREVVIRAGNVGALDFFFNGKKLPSQGEYGTVKTLTFHSDGLQPGPPKAAAPVSR